MSRSHTDMQVYTLQNRILPVVVSPRLTQKSTTENKSSQAFYLKKLLPSVKIGDRSQLLYRLPAHFQLYLHKFDH